MTFHCCCCCFSGCTCKTWKRPQIKFTMRTSGTSGCSMERVTSDEGLCIWTCLVIFQCNELICLKFLTIAQSFGPYFLDYSIGSYHCCILVACMTLQHSNNIKLLTSTALQDVSWPNVDLHIVSPLCSDMPLPKQVAQRFTAHDFLIPM